MPSSTLALSSISPSNGTLGVSVKTNITLTFNKSIGYGSSGYIYLYNTTGDTKTLVEKFSPNSSRLVYSGKDLVIDVTDDLSGSQEYSIELDRGSIVSSESNTDVVSQTSGYSFTTEAVVDTTPPNVVSTLPGDDAESVATDSNLSIKFDENIKFGATGVITVRKVLNGHAGDIFATYIVGSSSQLSIVGNTLIIDPAGKFLAETEYSVTLGNGSITDALGNKILGGEIFHFKTGQDGDPTPPVVLTPSTPSGSVALPSQYSNIIFSFNEFIQAGSGHVTLFESSDGITYATFEDFNMASSSRRAYISGSDLIIDPTNPLSINKYYRVTIGLDAVEDLAGNPYNPLGASYTFTVVNEAFTHAIPVAFSPGRGVATAAKNANIEITFSQDVYLNPGTSIELYKADGSLIESFAINSQGENDRITILGSKVFIDPIASFAFNSEYALVIANQILDSYGEPISFSYTFKTGPDRIAPIKISSAVDGTPVAGAAAVTSNFLVTFDEAIKKGTGKIYLKDSNNKTIETFDNKSSAVTIENGLVDGVLIQNSQLKINPTNDLKFKTGYKIVLEAKAVTDLYGNAIEAMSGDTFTTPNRPPTAKSSTLTTKEDSIYVITKANLGYADPDSDPIVKIQLSQLPALGALKLNNVLVTEANTEVSISNIDLGRLTYTPALNGSGSAYDSFKFKVSDGTNYSLSENTALTFSVTPVNDAPTVANLIVDKSATEGSAFNFTLPGNIFNDVDGDALTFKATLDSGKPLPKWLSFNSVTGAFSGTPADADSATTLAIKVTATDTGKLTVSDNFNLVIEGVNVAPVGQALVAVSATEGKAFSYKLPKNAFTDGDKGDVLTYSSSNLPTWLTINSATGDISGTPDYTAADGDYQTVSIKASDRAGLFDTKDLRINLINTPTITGTALANTLTGGNGADTIKSGAGDDVLNGGSGNDVLWGELGNDTLLGGAGLDTLIGGLGNDALTGGVSNDIFLFNTALSTLSASNVDTITDFTTGDQIQLSLSIFKGLTKDGLTTAQFYSSAGATTAQDTFDRIIFNQTTGDLYYDADGSGTKSAAVKMATITIIGDHALSISDFLVV